MGDMRMYQDERRLDFHALGREIKRKREAKSIAGTGGQGLAAENGSAMHP